MYVLRKRDIELNIENNAKTNLPLMNAQWVASELKCNFQLYISHWSTSSKAKTEFSMHLHCITETQWVEHK
jgi:hypothetical protein